MGSFNNVPNNLMGWRLVIAISPRGRWRHPRLSDIPAQLHPDREAQHLPPSLGCLSADRELCACGAFFTWRLSPGRETLMSCLSASPLSSPGAGSEEESQFSLRALRPRLMKHAEGFLASLVNAASQTVLRLNLSKHHKHALEQQSTILGR